MKIFYKEVFYYLLIILGISLPWFFNSGYLFFIDFSFGPNVALNFLSSNFFTVLLIKVFSLFYFYGFGQKIFFTAVLLIILLGGKKISENFTENKFAIFLSSLFFLFNPFVYDRIMYGQINIVGAFGLLCLGTGYLLQYIKTGDKRRIYFAGLFIGLSMQMSLHFIFFFSVIFLLFIGNLLFNKISLNVVLKISLLLIITVVVLNSNYLLGFIINSSDTLNFINNGIQERDLEVFQTSGKTAFEATINTLMMSGFWGKDQLRYIDLTIQKGNWGRSFLFLLPFILWGVISAIRKKEIKPLAIGLIIMFLIATILALGIRLAIFKEITYWLFNNFTLYKGLRETQKWVVLIIIVYGIFLAIGLDRLFNKNLVKNNKILTLILIGSVIIMQSPFILFGLRGQISPVDFPNDWYEANNYITSNQKADDANNKKCSGQILFLPWHLYMGFQWVGRVIFNPASSFFECPVIQGTNMEWGGIYDNSLNPNSKVIEQWINKPHDISFLNDSGLNIKYIILAKEVDWKSYSWLDKMSGLQLEKETDNLKIYKVLNRDASN